MVQTDATSYTLSQREHLVNGVGILTNHRVTEKMETASPVAVSFPLFLSLFSSKKPLNPHKTLLPVKLSALLDALFALGIRRRTDA